MQAPVAGARERRWRRSIWSRILTLWSPVRGGMVQCVWGLMAVPKYTGPLDFRNAIKICPHFFGNRALSHVTIRSQPSTEASHLRRTWWGNLELCYFPGQTCPGHSFSWLRLEAQPKPCDRSLVQVVV
mmetsp:Transcript_45394/g.73122  ORF Transcript_45394/g.73122 Transcript_45394/m.73122 type:complete len:128 (-) Transcript_45394:928-1311(-)